MRFSVCVAVVSLLLLIVYAGAQTTCPECYHDRPRPTGNGASPTSDGRVRLQIYVDDAGMSSSQQDLAWNAVDGAANMWNTTTADGGTTDYFIEPNLLNQHQATFVVRIGQPGGAGCAEIDTTVIPHVITVSSALLSAPLADRRAIIAHEIGHRLGLAEARQGGTCGSSSTIMRGATTSCTAAIKSISSNDVRQVRRGDYQQSTCTQSQPTRAVVEQDNCLDEDGDGITTCAGDCNDYDPAVAYDCSGGCMYFADESLQSDIANNSCSNFIDDDCDGATDWQDTGCYYVSPILVDIAGDGFALTDVSHGVVFDITGRGRPLRLAWTAVGSDDAWLALDRDGDGAIGGGSELFGDLTPQPPSAAPNGFLALAEFDKPENGGNSDSMIDSGDTVFASLRLWRDTNHDGVSQPSELHALPELSLATLDLKYKESKRTDLYGNQFRYRAKVKDVHGAQVGRWAWDVFLVTGQ